jgi:N-acetylglucosamine kinase-like BadF-type ATPase
VRLWAIDAGGSGTTALLDDGTRWRRNSVNPASVGAAAAEAELADLLCAVAAATKGSRTRGWLATATVDGGAPSSEVDRLAGLANRCGLTGTMVISRDILPLLVAPPLRGRGVAVIAGTGSGFLAGDGGTAPLSVGGCEYLGSDEGSAFAIGLAGLRAAVRGADGRGPATALSAALADSNGTVQESARRLAELPFPKAPVAALAPIVSRCWLDGDEMAGDVMRTAVDDLLAGVRAARDRAGLTGSWSATLAGGVFRGCPEFAESLRTRIVEELGADPPPTVIDDPVATVLAAVRAHEELPEAVTGAWAWTRSLGGPR